MLITSTGVLRSIDQEVKPSMMDGNASRTDRFNRYLSSSTTDLYAVISISRHQSCQNFNFAGVLIGQKSCTSLITE
jgi:hypothetical protein